MDRLDHADDEVHQGVDMNKKSIFLNQTLIIWLFQIVCCVMITCYVFRNETTYQAFISFPNNEWDVLMKFISSIVLHLYLQPRLRQGLDVMKFVANHSYRFESPWLAFITGFMQSSSIFFNEIVCFLVLAYSTVTLDILRNFFALVIIAEFEDYLYLSLRDEPAKCLLTEPNFEDVCLTIARTTSERATAKVKQNLIEEISLSASEQQEEGIRIPEYIHVHERNWNERVMFVVYKFLRVVYVSVWFYFIPFVFLWGQYTLPIYLNAAYTFK